MRCPYCGSVEDRLVDSRESRERDAIRRRREYVRCERRFTSYERVERVPFQEQPLHSTVRVLPCTRGPHD